MWWFWAPIMMIGCVVMMFMMMGGMTRPGGRSAQHGEAHGQQPEPDHVQQPESAEQILADRFARGEIDEDEFTRRVALLHRG